MDQKPKLKWDNLKKGRCPKCSSFLIQPNAWDNLYCQKPVAKCGFLISQKKLKQILEGYNPVRIQANEMPKNDDIDLGDVEND